MQKKYTSKGLQCLICDHYPCLQYIFFLLLIISIIKKKRNAAIMKHNSNRPSSKHSSNSSLLKHNCNIPILRVSILHSVFVPLRTSVGQQLLTMRVKCQLETMCQIPNLLHHHLNKEQISPISSTTTSLAKQTIGSSFYFSNLIVLLCYFERHPAAKK